MGVWRNLCRELAHAFALAPPEPELSPAEIALLEKMARTIIKREMTTPAILFLESVGPLTFLGSQIVHGLRPFLDLVGNTEDIERLAALLERRGSMEHLIVLIQERSTPSA